MPRLLTVRLAPLWPALTAAVVLTLLCVRIVPSLFEEASVEALHDTLTLLERDTRPEARLESAGSESAAEIGGSAEALQRRVSQLTAGTSLRVTVIRPDGSVIADSDRTPAEVLRMDDHSTRPEVAAALAGGAGGSVRRSATTSRRYVYAARAFVSPAGEPYVLRLARPVDRTDLVRSGLLEALALALAAILAAVVLTRIWLDRRFSRPFARLVDGASRLAEEPVGRRLPAPSQPDLARLAGALGRITDRFEEQVASSRSESARLRSILASMAEGVLVVDDEGRAVYANPAFRRLFGLPEEVAGRLPFDLVRRPELAEVIDEALATGASAREEVVIERNGEPRTVALAGAALRPEEGGGSAGEPGAVVAARDTTALQRLARVRSDFVANVSHELKTPLSAIRGCAETLRDGALDDPEAAGRFTERILVQCHRLQALLDDLLTLSRLESVEAPLDRRPVDPVRLVERCLETCGPAAGERGVELVWTPPAEPPPRIDGDRDALERLLLNLLDNAVKYTPAGGRVEVRVEDAAGPAGRTVVLEVADTGRGIPAHALPRIFERFYRVDRGRARDEGGTGLGLAIVKHVAQAHGGRVEVEGRPGGGTIFRCHLPAAQDDGRAGLAGS